MISLSGVFQAQTIYLDYAHAHTHTHLPARGREERGCIFYSGWLCCLDWPQQEISLS